MDLTVKPSSVGCSGIQARELIDSAFPLQDNLTWQIMYFLQFLRITWRRKQQPPRTEMLNVVIRDYEHYYPGIVNKTSQSMRQAVGFHITEVDPIAHSSWLVSTIGIPLMGCYMKFWHSQNRPIHHNHRGHQLHWGDCQGSDVYHGPGFPEGTIHVEKSGVKVLSILAEQDLRWDN